LSRRVQNGTSFAQCGGTPKQESAVAIQDIIQQHLTPEMIDQISTQIGADPGTTRQAVNAAVPMLMGGVAAHASTPQGAQAIESATPSGGASMLGGLGGMLGGSGGSGGLGDVLGGLGGMMGGGMGGILGNILGGHESTVQDGVSQASGLDPQKAKRLLMILGPIVLAAIAHHRSQTGASASQVSNDLQREAQQHTNNPHFGGLLGGILNKAMGQS
jgi:hypothetical protein